MAIDLFFEIIKWVLATVIALSGWTTLLYNWFTSKPKIRGQIFNVITGSMPNPNNPNQILTAFNVYLYLTNTRKNTVHILDYELEVDTGAGYERMKRVYGAHEIPNWFFGSETHTIEIPDYPKKLITAQAKPIEYGVPLHGFVLFASEKPIDNFKENVKRFKVTCVDAFNGRHEIVSSKQFPSIYLLQDLAGMKMIPKKGGDQIMKSNKIPVRNQTFKNEDIYLDGHSWFKCKFHNCNIIIERGEFDVVQCEFQDCKLTAKGNAISMLKIVKLFFPQIPLINDTES